MQILTIKEYQYGLVIVSIATNSVTTEFEGQATPRSAIKMTPQIKSQSYTEHFRLLRHAMIYYYPL